MLSAHDPYNTSYDSTMFGPPEPPRWPRIAARIVGTIGLVLIAPFALIMALGMILSLVGIGESEAPSPGTYLMMVILTVPSTILGLGLLIAWLREGLGALLIFVGSTLLIIGTLGFALVIIFPAPIVGGLYLLSWALHRTDDTGSGRLDRFSRWVRGAYYGQRQETF